MGRVDVGMLGLGVVTKYDKKNTLYALQISLRINKNDVF